MWLESSKQDGECFRSQTMQYFLDHAKDLHIYNKAITHIHTCSFFTE